MKLVYVVLVVGGNFVRVREYSHTAAEAYGHGVLDSDSNAVAWQWPCSRDAFDYYDDEQIDVDLLFDECTNAVRKLKANP